tara:strand:+ start:173 stop:349 length:177 start_codon:yes stop_codon:yes gene_type:complete
MKSKYEIDWVEENRKRFLRLLSEYKPETEEEYQDRKFLEAIEFNNRLQKLNKMLYSKK